MGIAAILKGGRLAGREAVELAHTTGTAVLRYGLGIRRPHENKNQD
jgi:hypothetical protein